MSDEQEQRSGTGRKIARGTGNVVLAPFRAVGQSGKLTKDQFVRSLKAGNLGEASGQIRQNWQRAHQKGRNDQFFDIFGGEDGPELLQMNLRRFLVRKRTALALMAVFATYGFISVVVFKAFFGLLGMAGAIMLGTAWATEAQFRLWQLRNHRLSREEKGSFPDFWAEQPIHRILDPELFGGRRHDQ